MYQRHPRTFLIASWVFLMLMMIFRQGIREHVILVYMSVTVLAVLVVDILRNQKPIA